MNCKHSDTIAISENGKEYYCKAKQKRITEYDCRNCMLRLPNLPERFRRNIRERI